MRILVCGGRAYTDYEVVKTQLDRLHKQHKITVLIQGGALGADYLAKTWAQQNGIKIIEYLANWKKYGKAAGPLRNAQMLEHGAPDCCVAFPGGTGTNDMMSRALKANIWTLDIRRNISLRPNDVGEFDFRTYMKNRSEKPSNPPEDA